MLTNCFQQHNFLFYGLSFSFHISSSPSRYLSTISFLMMSIIIIISCICYCCCSSLVDISIHIYFFPITICVGGCFLLVTFLLELLSELELKPVTNCLNQVHSSYNCHDSRDEKGKTCFIFFFWFRVMFNNVNYP